MGEDLELKVCWVKAGTEPGQLCAAGEVLVPPRASWLHW